MAGMFGLTYKVIYKIRLEGQQDNKVILITLKRDYRKQTLGIKVLAVFALL